MRKDCVGMADSRTSSSRIRTHVVIDVMVILFISFVAQATHYSYKQGRALICADSAQYVASAEALLASDKTPHFEMRKPGYVFFLAGVFLALGNMGWAAVIGHHVLLGLLPLAAYGWGLHLRSRLVGWLAAMLTVARLQEVVWGDRMLSEPLFAVLFSFGLLLFVVALSRDGAHRWMLSAGILLGLAWLTRGSASPTIAVAVVAILIITRRAWRRALASIALFATPILCCVILECALNLAYSGQFRPSNGTVGPLVLLRARHFEGLDLPETEDAARVFALLPRRDRDSAYIASHLDVWVARYHAIHDLGMAEWEFGRLMGRVGRDALAEHFGAYLTSSLRLALCHLLRNPDGQGLSRVSEDRRTGPLLHTGTPVDPPQADWDTTWFAYYGLPHLSPDESVALVDRMKTAAAQRAPAGGANVWKALRYWKAKPIAQRSLAGLVWLGSIWPGFALLGFPLLGLKRRTCLFLATAYLVDALFIGFLTTTSMRLQFIWIVTDTALAAGLVVGLLDIARIRLSAIRRPLKSGRFAAARS